MRTSTTAASAKAAKTAKTSANPIGMSAAMAEWAARQPWYIRRYELADGSFAVVVSCSKSALDRATFRQFSKLRQWAGLESKQYTHFHTNVG